MEQIAKSEAQVAVYEIDLLPVTDRWPAYRRSPISTGTRQPRQQVIIVHPQRANHELSPFTLASNHILADSIQIDKAEVVWLLGAECAQAAGDEENGRPSRFQAYRLHLPLAGT